MFAAAVGALAFVGLAPAPRRRWSMLTRTSPRSRSRARRSRSASKKAARERQGAELQFVNIKKFAPQKSSIGLIKRRGDLLFIHVNSFAVPDANGFVNLRYKIKGKGGTDTAFVRIPIGAISAT